MHNEISGGAPASASSVVQRVVPAYVLALFDIAQFSSVLQPMIQQGYLETSFEDYLESRNGYWTNTQMDSFTERFDKHRGTTITRTRPGLKAPVQAPINPAAAQLAPTDGIAPSSFAVEQYTFTPFELGDGDEIDLIGTNFAIVDRFKHMVKVNDHQAEQSMDVLARDTYTAGYAVGASFATAAQATTGANAIVQMDDIRGLDTVIVNGQVLPVSPTNPLPAIVYPGGVRANGYAVMINGATAAPGNTSSMAFVLAGLPGSPFPTRGNGISGSISVVNLPNAIVKGDIVVAGDAPFQIVGVANKLHFSQLSAASGDTILTSAMLIAARGYLENNGVPFAQNRDSETEGTYAWHGAANTMMSLYNDPDFKQANQTLGQSTIYQNGKVSQYLGVTFLTNTNAPRISLPTGGFAYLSILTGQDCIMDEWYEGLEDWADNQLNPAHVTLRRGIAQILMPAYADVQGRRARMSWLSIRDMICPTDVTRSSVIMTGSGTRRTRALALWTYGAV